VTQGPQVAWMSLRTSMPHQGTHLSSHRDLLSQDFSSGFQCTASILLWQARVGAAYVHVARQGHFFNLTNLCPEAVAYIAAPQTLWHTNLQARSTYT